MNAPLAALLRTELKYFIWKVFETVLPGTPYMQNWHVDAIVYQLMRVDSGHNKRLLINQPPRSLKSITASVAYPAWLLGRDPTRRIIVVSYSNELSAELHRQFRMVVEAPWYKALFPATRPARDSGSEFVTTAGGSRYATSVGGTLTGRGADLIIIDDPLKAEDALSDVSRQRLIDWYGGSLVSRLNNKQTGSIVVVMQRLHENDLAGHLLDQGGWYHLDLPAIATEDCSVPVGHYRVFARKAGQVLHEDREDAVVLDEIKAEIGSLMFSAQYQQRPIPIEGNLIKRDWFRFYDSPPAIGPGISIVQSWDTASMTGLANDYSVCTTWLVAKSDYYLIDVCRVRLQYPDLRRKVATLASKYATTAILIEDAGPGLQLLQDLQRETPNGMIRPIGIRPDGSKVDRMAAQSAKIEAGHVHLPRAAEWMDIFMFEMLGFPAARHDDQVDSVSQFLKWVNSRAPTHIAIGLISTGNHYDE